jgi:beta-lactamase regulating signal transducer with metallopeptidase domain
MTAVLAALIASSALVVAGWVLLVVVWETTALAIALAAWRLTHPLASARRQYFACVLALGAAAALALVTSVALPRTAASFSSPLAPVAGGPAVVARPLTVSATPRTLFEIGPHAAPITADSLAGAAGVLWAAGVLILGIRLLGGGLLAASIRRRSRPIESESARHAAERIRADLNLTDPVRLLQSDHVEAPVIIGWRRPALILPTDVAEHLTPDMIDAVLAHEFAHVKRRDYVANLLQSVVEVLLFFSPAVIWISGRIREAREYCCDDDAVDRCGDPGHYVRALTTLASLATVNTARPALGAAGPRLIIRVRRLLQEESMPKFMSLRLIALATMLLAVLVTGVRVTAVSAGNASRFIGDGARVAAGRQTPIPFGWATEQTGSGVVVGPLTWEAGTGEVRARVKNTTTETITGLRFVAVVERFPIRGPVRLVTPEFTSVSIGPAQTADVSAPVLSPEQLQHVPQGPGEHVQLFFGLQAVKFANGAQWSITPNPAAENGSDALGIERSEIPRNMLATEGAAGSDQNLLCRDQAGREIAAGAIIKVRNEPGHFARCIAGRWEEWDLRRR